MSRLSLIVGILLCIAGVAIMVTSVTADYGYLVTNHNNANRSSWSMNNLTQLFQV